MLNITNIPAPRVPFMDERTGLLAREWYRFFLNLFVLTGSGNNPITLEELQLGPPNQPDLTELLIQINQNIAPQYEDQSGDFLATLDTAQLMSMMSRFENAEAAIQGAYLQPVVQTGTIANYNLDGSPTAGGIAYGTGPALAVSAAGTLGQVLTSGGAGTPTWAAAATGTVTSVAALTLGTSGTDLSSTVANSTTTPVITLQVPTASASNRGALSAADWTTFNSKQPAGSYLVNGGALGTPSSGTVTNLTGTASININGTVGATTPAAVAATTLSATGITTVAAGSAALPAIVSTTGTADTGLWFPAADTLAVSTSGVECMRFTSDGRIRFISSSSYNGQQDARIQWVNENSAGVMGQISCVREASPAAPGALAFYTSPDVDVYGYTPFERMRISSAGIVTMSVYGAGAATFSAAGVISSVSDETWKTKDGIPTDPDAMLQKLAPGYWYYNDEKKETFGTDRQLGFYAQNVNAAIGPEAAPEPEEGKPWGYYDRSVLAVTVMSLQKALLAIKQLTAKVAALENQLRVST